MQEGGRNNAVRLRTFPLLRMLSATNLRTAGSLSFNNGRCKNTPFVSTSIIPYLFNKWGAVCSLWDDRVNLYDDVYYVRNSLHMPHSSTALSLIFCSSPGTHLLYHLTPDGTCLAGGQVTVVAVGQVDTDLPWCTYYIVNSPDESGSEGWVLLGTNSRIGSLTISPMNL